MISIAIIASIGEKSTGPVLNFINNLRNGATTGSVILARNWYILPADEYGLYATKKLITHMAIRAKEINQYFGISESYLGRYIKKHTNETMQHYI